MKKILIFTLFLAIMSVNASAQAGRGNGLRKGQLTYVEKMELRKDVLRNRIIRNRAGRDGVITPMERRRIHRAKCDTRRDLFRFKHNSHRRLI